MVIHLPGLFAEIENNVQKGLKPGFGKLYFLQSAFSEKYEI